MTLIDLLIKHEGLKLKPYKDTVGKLTIGVGRNLDDVGLSEDECRILCQNDINKVLEKAKTLSFFNSLNEVRQWVIVSMIFNMGFGKFLQFQNFIFALGQGDYVSAANEMLNSQWASQVKSRAIELSEMMKSGVMRS